MKKVEKKSSLTVKRSKFNKAKKTNGRLYVNEDARCPQNVISCGSCVRERKCHGSEY